MSLIFVYISCILDSWQKFGVVPKQELSCCPPSELDIVLDFFNFLCYFQTSSFSSSSSRDWNKITPQSIRRTSHIFRHVVGKWTTFAVMTCQLSSPQLSKIPTTPASHLDCWLSVELGDTLTFPFSTRKGVHVAREWKNLSPRPRESRRGCTD